MLYEVITPEIIENDKTGYLVDFPDINSFADKTEELIRNIDLRKEFGFNGRKRLEEQFVLKDRVIEFEQFIIS